LELAMHVDGFMKRDGYGGGLRPPSATAIISLVILD
jgi:hypothetical protein